MKNNNLYYNIKIDNNELLKTIIKRVEQCIPTSVVRKSDGENIILGYLNIKGIKTRKYFKKLRHFNINILILNFNFFLEMNYLNHI